MLNVELMVMMRVGVIMTATVIVAVTVYVVNDDAVDGRPC